MPLEVFLRRHFLLHRCFVNLFFELNKRIFAFADRFCDIADLFLRITDRFGRCGKNTLGGLASYLNKASCFALQYAFRVLTLDLNNNV